MGIIDFHTGLGPRGYGEIIGRGAAVIPNTSGRSLGTVLRFEVQPSVITSVRLNGTIDFGYRRACPNAQQTAITLEFGTLLLEVVHDAIRADNWVYAKGGGTGFPLFVAIKSDIRAAFYGEDSQWKADIWARGQQIVEQALDGVKG